MSAVKYFALGMVVLGIAGRSALGGSMDSPTVVPLASTWPETAETTTPASSSPFGRTSVGWNSSHEESAQNLALATYTPAAPASSSDPSATRQLAVAGLHLGVTNWNSADSGNSANAQVNSPIVLSGSNVNSPIVLSSSNTTNPSPLPAPAPAVQPGPPSTPVRADAFINFGSAPYAESSSLTNGSAQPFFNSPTFAHFFGNNGPSSTDIANFENEVVSTIKSTYNGAGLPITLTTDPGTKAAHMMSVVSGTYYPGTPDAIGITDVGRNGFSFIDKFGGISSPNQLAIAIGHNLSHELMHAFGVVNHPEQTGPYVDAAMTSLPNLTNPDTSFSPAAAGLLSTLNFQAVGLSVSAGAQRIDGDQILIRDASTVPEPSTIAIWAMLGGMIVAYRHRTAA
jgi:hypothetical protein